ncbi:MAG: C40 family peptidase [Lishizhenia sp.]
MKTVVFFILLAFSSTAIGQVLKFDQLEMFYDQGHYKSVYRKSKRLIDNPEYDFALSPKFYKAISSLQLSRNRRWRKRHSEALSIASALLDEIQKSEKGQTLLKQHVYELSTLKKDLVSWAEDLKIQEETELFNQVSSILIKHFSGTTDLYEESFSIESENEISENSLESTRNNALKIAKKQLGVPYLWAGKSSEGFDCSGFTSYVLESQDITLPRRASDQKAAAKKVKKKDVKPGDLVFFDSGSGISHVGIVYSLENNSIQMIHASSSKGISIVDIYNSTYWNKRIDSFGTYF